jgi:enoyl-CoA hydratase
MSVLTEHRGPVLLITLNRPERRNALDAATIGGIGQALTDAETDSSVAVVVLTGAGDRAFCAGIDLSAFADNDGPPLPADGPGLEVLLRRVYPKPVIAAANGAAVAGGFELLLGCDLVVAAEHAIFGLPEVTRGLVASGCGLELLPRRLPLAIAMEMGLTGAPIDASRAAALGLVNHVVPGERVLDEALRLAEAIAANAPLAVGLTKQHMRRIGNGDQTDADRRMFEESVDGILASADAREGARAFAERRQPVWHGR